MRSWKDDSKAKAHFLQKEIKWEFNPLTPNYLLLLRGGPHLFPTQFDWKALETCSVPLWPVLEALGSWVFIHFAVASKVVAAKEKFAEWRCGPDQGREHPPEELAHGTNHSDFPRKGWISQSGPSEDQLIDPDQACNQVVPFGVFKRRDVNLYALCNTLYTRLVLSRNSY